jgi:hypothetical protein
MKRIIYAVVKLEIEMYDDCPLSEAMNLVECECNVSVKNWSCPYVLIEKATIVNVAETVITI